MCKEKYTLNIKNNAIMYTFENVKGEIFHWPFNLNHLATLTTTQTMTLTLLERKRRLRKLT